MKKILFFPLGATLGILCSSHFVYADIVDGVAHSPVSSEAIPGGGDRLHINKEDGSVSYEYDIGALQAKGMHLPLALKYSSGTNVNLHGLGTNWSITGLPTLVEYMPSKPTSDDPDTYTLYLGDGSSYSLLSSKNTDGSLQFSQQPNDGQLEGVKVFLCPTQCQTQPNPNGPIVSYLYRVVDTNSGLTYYLEPARQEPLQYKTADGAEYSNRYVQTALITNSSGSYITALFNAAVGAYNLTQYGKITLTSDTGAAYTFDLDFANSQINIDAPSYRRITLTYMYLPYGPGSPSKGKYPHDSTARNYPDSIITQMADKDLINNTHLITHFTYNPYDISSNPVDGRSTFSYDSNKLVYLTNSQNGYTSANTPLWYDSPNQPFINAAAKNPAKQKDTSLYPNEPSFSWGSSILSGVTFPSGKKAHVRFLNSTVYDNDHSINIDGIPKCRDDELNGAHHCGIYIYDHDYNAGAIFAVPYAINIDYSYTTTGGKLVTIKGKATLPGFNDTIPASSDYDYVASADPDQMHNYTAFPYVAGSYYSTQDAQWQMITRRQGGTKGGARGYGEADSQYLYQYNYNGYDYYVNEHAFQNYIAPHLLTQDTTTLATGDIVTTVNSFDNLGHAADSKNINQLRQQPKSYNMPSEVKVTARNGVIYDLAVLQRITNKTYTPFGDVRTVTLADGMTTVNYYNYDDEKYDSTYRHLTATVVLPDTTRATDNRKTPSATNVVNAYFTRFTVDPKTNLVTAGEQGYIPCQTDSNNKLEKTCFDLSAIATSANVPNSNLYKDVFSDTPPDKTGWISKQTRSYDSYGRIKSSAYYPSPTAAPNLAAVSFKKDYLEDYNSLTAEGVDILKLPTFLTSGNSADNPVWYVVTTTITNADSNGTWLRDPRVHKTLEIISQYTGKTLAAFNGYDQSTQSFLNGKTVSYDAYLIRRQTLDLNKDHATNFTYTIGAGKNQYSQVQYYCDDLVSPASVPSLDFLNSASCTSIKKASVVLDNMQRKVSATSYQSDDGGTTWTTLNNIQYSYNDGAGGVIAAEDTYYQGQHIGQTTPIYDAEHNAIGQMSYALPDGSDTSQYTDKVYQLAFQDTAGNRKITLKLFPCSGHCASSQYCAKSITIVQKERIDTGTTNSSGKEIYDAKGGRTISEAHYRYNQTNGYPMSNLPVLLATLTNKSAASDTQSNINGFIHALGLGNADGDAPDHTGLITDSNWMLLDKKDFYYDIYNHVTRTDYIAKESNSNTWKRRVQLRDYDIKNRLMKTSNVTTLNTVSFASGSSVNDPSGYSSQVLANGVPVNADITSTAYTYNDMDQLTSAVLYEDTLDGSSDITPENSTFYRAKNILYDADGHLRKLTICGGKNYPAAGCVAGAEDVQMAMDAQLIDANKEDASYDALGRLVAWVDASGNTHRKSYYATQQLKAKWIVNNSALAATPPICYAYNFAFNWKVASYYASDLVTDVAAMANCPYQDEASINNINEDIRGSMEMFSFTYNTKNNYLLSKTYPDGRKTESDYTTSGLLDSKTDIDGFTTKYIYFSQIGLLDTATIVDPNTGKSVASVNYAYDNQNRVNSQSFGGGSNASYAKTINENSYNTTLDRHWINSGNTILRTTETVDPAGTMASLSRQDFNNETSDSKYTFDAEKRVSANTERSQPNAYDYDGSGNLVNFGLNRDGLDQVSNSGYVYDKASNLIESPKGKYTYNNRNQLISFTADNGGVVWTYSYDPQGHLLQRKSGNETLTYYWDRLSLLNIRHENNGQTLEIAHNFLNRTAYFTTDASGDYQQDARYLVKGLNNNILGDISDTVLSVYTPYGHAITSSGSLTDVDHVFDLSYIPWAYKGGLSLPEMGAATLFYKRIYDADIRSFTQSDPIQNDFSRSRAFDADPLTHNDPTGLSVWHTIKHKISHNLKVGYRRTNVGIDIGLTKMQIDPVVTPLIANFLAGMITSTEGIVGGEMKQIQLLAHPRFDKGGWYKKLVTTQSLPVARTVYDGYKSLVMINVMAFKTGNWKLAIEAGLIDGFTIVTFGEGIEASGELAEIAEEGSDAELGAESESEHVERSDNSPRQRKGAVGEEAGRTKPFSQRLGKAMFDNVTGQVKFWERGNADNIRILNTVTFRNAKVQKKTANDQP